LTEHYDKNNRTATSVKGHACFQKVLSLRSI
jgi:hypothetical protein